MKPIPTKVSDRKVDQVLERLLSLSRIDAQICKSLLKPFVLTDHAVPIGTVLVRLIILLRNLDVHMMPRCGLFLI